MIWQWVDGDMAPQERASFVVHLANCDRCQSALWQAEQTVLMLRSLPKLKATAAEKEALKARLRSMGRRPTIVPFVWRVAFPIAAAAALLLIIFAQLRSPIHDQTTVVVHQPMITPSTEVEPSEQKPVVPEVAEKPSKLPKLQQPTYRQPAFVVQLPQQKPEQTQEPTKQQIQPTLAVEAKVKPEVKKLAIPEPSILVQSEPKPIPEVSVREPVVAEAPKLAMSSAIAVPIPSETPTSIPSPTELFEQAPTSQSAQVAQESPIVVPITSEPRRLVKLPPVTIEGDISLQPPRVKLTVVPPSQRLYQKSGVALVTVPPEKRPVKVTEEQALAPDLCIHLAAERYRSHTASIPLFRFGISW